MSLTLVRGACPLSKRATYQTKSDFLDMQSVSLQHFYHNLDKLSLYSTELQKLVF
ncbi:hypothetical protein [Hugenholtzia roseola]|uniref:hypothetical protein n=1 Tax=Hugenholtzia roseola TaxID=1002 RepID=UPI0003F5138B|nr:hypothetical protein [Hugenholtzia roseola]